MSENGNALLEQRWHRICTSSSTIEMSQVECAENCRDSAAERQMQKIQKMIRSEVQNMLIPDLEQTSLREKKRARRLHQTCLSRGLPADSEVQSQFRKDGYPHSVEAHPEERRYRKN